MKSKTKRPVQFELTENTRDSAANWVVSPEMIGCGEPPRVCVGFGRESLFFHHFHLSHASGHRSTPDAWTGQLNLPKTIALAVFEDGVALQTPISKMPGVQRARGCLSVSAGFEQTRGSHLRTLREEGSYRAIFPRPQHGNLEAVIINTAGGVTGGDQFSTTISANEKARISVTTQAAERIYRAAGSDAGQIKTTLTVATKAQLCWLPQETILFDGCRLERSLAVDVAPRAAFLMLEPLVFGRAASGENLNSCSLQDSVTITCRGQPLYHDRIKMDGDLAERLSRNAVANNARAMASLVMVDVAARERLSACRKLLPQTAGASALSENVIVMRFLAKDSFALRGAILPILKLLTDDAVPKNWRL